MVADIIKRAHQYLYFRDQQLQAKKKMDESRKQGKEDVLQQYITENGERDGDDIVWTFDEPTPSGYAGLKLQAKHNENFDEVRAVEMLREKGLLDRVERTVVVYDLDEIYNLNQEGLVSDDEIDSLISDNITYSLVVVK